MKLLFISCILVTIVAATHAQGIRGLFKLFTSSFQGLGTTKPVVPYDVIKNKTGYGERTIHASNWACVVQFGQVNSDLGFTKLFDYLEKGNSLDVDIPMSVPVSIEYKPITDGPSEYTACFYIHPDYQASPPKPHNKEITIVKRKTMTVLTREVGGFMIGTDDWLTEALKLGSIVTEAGEKYRTDVMYWNAYNSPLEFRNRRNEVWLVKLVNNS